MAGKPEIAARFQGVCGLSVRTMFSRGDKGLTSRVLPAGRVKSDPSCDVTVRAWRCSGAPGGPGRAGPAGRTGQGESRLTREGVRALICLKSVLSSPAHTGRGEGPAAFRHRPARGCRLSPAGFTRGPRVPPGLPQPDPSRPRPSGKSLSCGISPAETDGRTNPCDSSYRALTPGSSPASSGRVPFAPSL